MGGPLGAMGRRTGATGENCGVEKVGSESIAVGDSLLLVWPMVRAAIERMSMRPEPSVVPVVEGGRALVEPLGTAKASRLESEKRTEFSLR